jgi:hypothetical protein
MIDSILTMLSASPWLHEVLTRNDKSPRTLEQLKQAIALKVGLQEFSWDHISKVPSIQEKMIGIIGAPGDALRDLATALLVHDIKLDTLQAALENTEYNFKKLKAVLRNSRRNHKELQSKYNQHLEWSHEYQRHLAASPKRNRQRYRAWARRR